MNTIEQQLWDYIDGNLNAEQTQAIQEKINSDEEVKHLFESLLNMNATFEEMELDEPSMSFTRNVMEIIAAEPTPVALKTKVNTRIIYSIAGFFILSLLALLGYVLYHANLKFADINFQFSKNLNLDQYLTSTAVYSFLFIDLVLGLVFLDYLLRKNLIRK